jgi:hypothetical protein
LKTMQKSHNYFMHTTPEAHYSCEQLSSWIENLHRWLINLNICPVTFVFPNMECLSLYDVVYNFRAN